MVHKLANIGGKRGENCVQGFAGILWEVSLQRCAICEGLWREYATATNDHIRIEGKVKAAALRGEDEALLILTNELETAAQARVTIREAIKRHDTEAHTKIPLRSPSFWLRWRPQPLPPVST